MVRDLKQRDAKELAQGYSPAIRTLEVMSILSYTALVFALAVHLWPFARPMPWLTLLAGVAGYLGADFVSGFVHWAADTWGSVEMPLIGKALLRPFREHHVDPEAMTHHDFIETNGNNCLISIPTLCIGLFLSQGPGKTFNLFAAMFCDFLVLWVMGTNQFHKWAHLRKPRGLISLLQRVHLILPPAHHQTHHTAPFHSYYCITTGWLNYPLTWLRFFPFCEWLVSSTTGLIPRRDDIGEPPEPERIPVR